MSNQTYTKRLLKPSKSKFAKMERYDCMTKAISFDSVKVCYPFTIKGEWCSLLCCQPEAVPTSLTTFDTLITRHAQCWPRTWTDKPRHRVIPGSLLPQQSILLPNLQCDRQKPKTTIPTSKTLYTKVSYTIKNLWVKGFIVIVFSMINSYKGVLGFWGFGVLGW